MFGNILSSMLNYIFTTVIFLFILSVIRLIYKDIREIYADIENDGDYEDDDYDE